MVKDGSQQDKQEEEKEAKIAKPAVMEVKGSHHMLMSGYGCLHHMWSSSTVQQKEALCNVNIKS